VKEKSVMCKMQSEKCKIALLPKYFQLWIKNEEYPITLSSYEITENLDKGLDGGIFVYHSSFQYFF